MLTHRPTWDRRNSSPWWAAVPPRSKPPSRDPRPCPSVRTDCSETIENSALNWVIMLVETKHFPTVSEADNFVNMKSIIWQHISQPNKQMPPCWPYFRDRYTDRYGEIHNLRQQLSENRYYLSRSADYCYYTQTMYIIIQPARKRLTLLNFNLARFLFVACCDLCPRKMTAGFMSDNYWPDRRRSSAQSGWPCRAGLLWALDLWNGINIFNCLTSCMPLFINFSPHPFLARNHRHRRRRVTNIFIKMSYANRYWIAIEKPYARFIYQSKSGRNVTSQIWLYRSFDLP